MRSNSLVGTRTYNKVPASERPVAATGKHEAKTTGTEHKCNLYPGCFIPKQTFKVPVINTINQCANKLDAKYDHDECHMQSHCMPNVNTMSATYKHNECHI